MSHIKNAIKPLIFSTLPVGILQVLKKYYYPRVLMSMPIDDEPDLKVLQYLINPGDCVVDIGSNIGVYTKAMADLVGKSGHVYSIEPIPLTFEILSSNVRKLGLSNVTPIQYAISEIDGSVIMEVPHYQYGGENFYRARVVEGTETNRVRRVKVQSTTIDSLCSQWKCDVSFIKCDVEGHALQCVKGAIKVIAEAKPAWLIEIAPSRDASGSEEEKAFTLLEKVGYSAYRFHGDALMKSQPHVEGLNYFFLMARHVRVLKERGVIVNEG